MLSSYVQTLYLASLKGGPFMVASLVSTDSENFVASVLKNT